MNHKQIEILEKQEMVIGDIGASKIPIEELDLSIKIFNALKQQHINTIGDLLNWHKSDLLKLKNFEMPLLYSLNIALSKYKIKLKE